MHLIYINEIGVDFKNQKQYEFIFSNSRDIDMEDWFAIPASSISTNKSPDIQYIDVIGLLKNTDLELELIQDSDYFGVIDAIDGVISLGWEKFDYDIVDERLTFKFAESYDNVIKKLKKRDYELKLEKIK